MLAVKCPCRKIAKSLKRSITQSKATAYLNLIASRCEECPSEKAAVLGGTDFGGLSCLPSPFDSFEINVPVAVTPCDEEGARFDRERDPDTTARVAILYEVRCSLKTLGVDCYG